MIYYYIHYIQVLNLFVFLFIYIQRISQYDWLPPMLQDYDGGKRRTRKRSVRKNKHTKKIRRTRRVKHIRSRKTKKI